MASYKVLSDISTLGAQGASISDADIEAAGVDVELLIASGIVEPTTKTTSKSQED
jgi:hypothetical protein